MNIEPLFSKASDEWRTPLDLYQRYDRIWHFTVDGAASAANAQHPCYWDQATNALIQDWAGHTVWLNPPYSQIHPFLM